MPELPRLKARPAHEMLKVFEKPKAVTERDAAEAWASVANALLDMRDGIRKVKSSGKQWKTPPNTGKLWDESGKLLCRLADFSKANANKPVHEMLAMAPGHGLIELVSGFFHDYYYGLSTTPADTIARMDYANMHIRGIIDAMGMAEEVGVPKIRLTAPELDGFLFNHMRRIGHIDHGLMKLSKSGGKAAIRLSIKSGLKQGETLELSPGELFAISRAVSNALHSTQAKTGLSEFPLLKKRAIPENVEALRRLSPKWQVEMNESGGISNYEFALRYAAIPGFHRDIEALEKAEKNGDKILPMGEMKSRWARALEDYAHFVPGRVLNRLRDGNDIAIIGPNKRTEYLIRVVSWGRGREEKKALLAINPGADYRGHIQLRIRKSGNAVDVTVEDNGLGKDMPLLSKIRGKGYSSKVVDAMGIKREMELHDGGAVATLRSIGKVL